MTIDEKLEDAGESQEEIQEPLRCEKCGALPGGRYDQSLEPEEIAKQFYEDFSRAYVEKRVKDPANPNYQKTRRLLSFFIPDEATVDLLSAHASAYIGPFLSNSILGGDKG